MEITKVNLGNQEPEVYKVDLDNPPTQETKEVTNETEETTADPAGVVGSDENTDTPQEQEEVQPQGEVQEAEAPVLEEVTEEEGILNSILSKRFLVIFFYLIYEFSWV